MKSENVEILSIAVITTAMKMTANDFPREAQDRKRHFVNVRHILPV